MNSLILISPSKGSGFKPIVSGNEDFSSSEKLGLKSSLQTNFIVAIQGKIELLKSSKKE
ncbi:MAG: hypothetical protein ACMG55_18150 [Microcoleus sp.]